MGTAMTMAMKEMSAVPANSGTAPKEPDDPTWSARIAICGLHEVPNRKSMGEIMREEAEGFEGHRGDDADGGEHRDRRTADQQPFDDAFDAIARAQLGRDARADHDDGADRHHHDEHGERHAADAAQVHVFGGGGAHRLR